MRPVSRMPSGETALTSTDPVKRCFVVRLLNSYSQRSPILGKRGSSMPMPASAREDCEGALRVLLEVGLEVLRVGARLDRVPEGELHLQRIGRGRRLGPGGQVAPLELFLELGLLLGEHLRDHALHLALHLGL